MIDLISAWDVSEEDLKSGTNPAIKLLWPIKWNRAFDNNFCCNGPDRWNESKTERVFVFLELSHWLLSPERQLEIGKFSDRVILLYVYGSCCLLHGTLIRSHANQKFIFEVFQVATTDGTITLSIRTMIIYPSVLLPDYSISLSSTGKHWITHVISSNVSTANLAPVAFVGNGPYYHHMIYDFC